MTSKAATPQEYLDELPADRKKAMAELRSAIKKNLPKGFSEMMGYGMLGYAVPHKLYPAGYHCDPKLPLPFAGIASQKNFIAVYPMGIYASPELLQWFVAEYKKRVASKLDMGKSCIRFKKPEQIPFDLIGELFSKMSVEDWIGLYEKNLKRGKRVLWVKCWVLSAWLRAITRDRACSRAISPQVRAQMKAHPAQVWV